MAEHTGDQKPRLTLVLKCSACGEDHEVEIKAISPITFGMQTYERGFTCPNGGDLVVVWREAGDGRG